MISRALASVGAATVAHVVAPFFYAFVLFIQSEEVDGIVVEDVALLFLGQAVSRLHAFV